MSDIIAKMNKQKEDADQAGRNLIIADDDRKRQTREIALSMSIESIGSTGSGYSSNIIIERAEEFEKYLNGGL